MKVAKDGAKGFLPRGGLVGSLRSQVVEDRVILDEAGEGAKGILSHGGIVPVLLDEFVDDEGVDVRNHGPPQGLRARANHS